MMKLSELPFAVRINLPALTMAWQIKLVDPWHRSGGVSDFAEPAERRQRNPPPMRVVPLPLTTDHLPRAWLTPEWIPHRHSWHLACSVHAKARPQSRGRFRLRQMMQEVSRSGAAGDLRLDGLIADLWWRVRLLNTDILEEEAKAGVFDVHQPTYPMLALNLRARRDNLVSTIGVLEQRAGSASEAA